MQLALRSEKRAGTCTQLMSARTRCSPTRPSIPSHPPQSLCQYGLLGNWPSPELPMLQLPAAPAENSAAMMRHTAKHTAAAAPGHQCHVKVLAACWVQAQPSSSCSRQLRVCQGCHTSVSCWFLPLPCVG